MKGGCPEVDRAEFKTLEKLLGYDKAYKFILSLGHYPDPEVEALKHFRTDAKTRERKIAKVREFHRTLNEPTGNVYESVDGTKKYTRVSVDLDKDPDTAYRGKGVGEAYSDRGTVVHSIFEQIINGVSAGALKTYAEQNKIPFSFLDSAQQFIKQLQKTGTVIAEIRTGNADASIAGTVDIYHFKDNGTYDIYDIKTAHQTPSRSENMWDLDDHEGYKRRRYSTQLAYYSNMSENIISHPPTNEYIVPFEMYYKDFTQREDGTVVPGEIKEIIKKDIISLDEMGYAREARRKASRVLDKKNKVHISLNKVDDSGQLLIKLGVVPRFDPKDLDLQAEEFVQFHSRGNGYRDPNTGDYVRYRSENIESRKKQIIDEVLTKEESNYRDIAASIDNYLATGEDAFLSQEGQFADTVRRIIRPFVGTEAQVIKLNEVPNFESKRNWILIKNGNDYQLLNIGSKNLNEKLGTIRDGTLFGNFYGKKEAELLLKSNLKNNVRDALSLEAGMIAMRLKNDNPDISISRIVLYSSDKKGYTPAVPVRLSEVLPVIANMQNANKLSDQIPTNLREAMANELVMDAKNYQPDFLKVYMDYLHTLGDEANSRIMKGLDDYDNKKIGKEQALDFIGDEISRLRENITSQEEREQSKELSYLSSLYAQIKDSYDDKPVTWWQSMMRLPENIPNKLIQDTVLSLREGLLKFTRLYWDEYKQPFRKIQKALFNRYEFGDQLIKAPGDYILGNTTKYYNRLFQTRTVTVPDPANGVNATREVTVNAYKLVEEGSDAFKDLSEPEQKAITFINDQIEKGVRTIYGLAPDEKVNWERGQIPLVRSSLSNKIFKAGINLKEYDGVLSKYWQSLSDNFEFTNNSNISEPGIKDRFAGQASKTSIRRMLGMSDDNYVHDLDQYNDFETNLEVVLDLFMMNAYKHKALKQSNDAFNAAKTFFEIKRSDLFDDDLKHNLEWTDIYQKAQIEQRDRDAGSTVNKIIKSASAITSFGALGFVPRIAVQAGIGQMLTALSQAVTNTFSGNEYFKLSHFAKAGKYILDVRNYSKIEAIMNQYRLYDLDLNSIVSSNRRYGNRSVLKGKYAYGMLRMADWITRGQIIVAQMLYDGVWDAYSMKDGVLVYDETKDKRFNGKGRFKKEEGEALKAVLKEELAKDGGLDENGNMTRAYDMKLAIKYKSMSDSLIGGMDRDTRVAAGFTNAGRAFLLFKNWLPARIDRATMPEMVNMARGNYRFETDSDGKVHAVWQGKQMEGIFHTFWQTAYYLQQMARGDKGEKVTLTPYQRENLRRFVSDAVIFGILTATAMAVEDEDEGTETTKQEREVRRKFAKIIRGSLQDVLATYNFFNLGQQVITSPFPAASYALNVMSKSWNALTGIGDPESKSLEKIISMTPIARELQYLDNVLNDETMQELVTPSETKE